MDRGRAERLVVTRCRGAGADRELGRQPDLLIVEEPMAIELDRTRVATTMRTPGHDEELAVGFCFGEGLLGGARLRSVHSRASGVSAASQLDVVAVETDASGPAPTPRLGNVSSSCGWCGSEQLEQLCGRLTPLRAPDSVDLDLLASIPERARAEQTLFAETGAAHGAVAFDADGMVVVVREDVGRHNAVDKVVGALVLGSVVGRPAATDAPGAGLGLFVSGRASIEMVQKAWAAGFGWLVSVSAPTSLAVDAARTGQLVLAGFFRDGDFNLYSPERFP